MKSQNMMSNNVGEMTISELAEGYRYRHFSIRETVRHYLERIAKLDEGLGTFITVCKETALREAEKLDEGLSRGGDIGLLGGIPLVVADNICTRGIRTTCASRALEDFVPSYDAAAVERLKAAGALIIGKTGLNEFAIGASTEGTAHQAACFFGNLRKGSRAYGDLTCGSAAALAAGFAPLALSSSTRGAVTLSAAFYGLVGLKPTCGTVSRYGLIPFTSTLDQIGLMARDTRDCALAFQIIRNNVNTSDTEELSKGVEGLRIGIPKELTECIREQNQELAAAIHKAIRIYERLGAEVGEMSLPPADGCLSAYEIIASAEAGSNLARYDGMHYGYCSDMPPDEAEHNLNEMIIRSRTESFGMEVKRCIILGTYVLSTEHGAACLRKAVQVRRRVQNAWKEAFRHCDLMLLPVLSDSNGFSVTDGYAMMMDMAGIPAVTVPCGFSSSALPIGLQLAADHYKEGRLLRAAYSLEQELALTGFRPVWKEADRFV